MSRPASYLLAALFLFCLDSAFANQAAGMFPNVRESNINLTVYQSTYENLGSSKDVPKLIVFSPAGVCVGVTDTKSLGASGVVGFINGSLHRHQKACDATVANQFGVSEPGPNLGTGKPEIFLIVFDIPFCTACGEVKTALLRASHGELANMQLRIISVLLDKHK